MKDLRANRVKFEADFLNTDRRRLISPFYYGQYKVALPLIKHHARGRLIDLGCGDMPYRPEVVNQVESYDTLDFQPRSAEVTYVGSVEDMSFIPDATYDSAICLEVLEHVPDPFSAAHEIYRILKPGGVLVLSVPHLSRLHDLPHDYYRYTAYGLRHLLGKAGFQVLQVENRGGLLAFLGHQWSIGVLALVWSIPLVRDLVFWLNSWLVTRLFYRLDQILRLDRLFPLGYVVVATK